MRLRPLLLLLLALMGAACSANPVLVPSTSLPATTPQPATSTPEQEQPSLAGRWTGKVILSDRELLIGVEFMNSVDGWQGSIRIPAQGIPFLSLSGIVFEPPQVRFEVVGAQAVFQGELQGDSLRGDFAQPGVSGSFELRRSEERPGGE